MDFLSHGLWTGVAFAKTRRRTLRWAVIFGLLPDFISFGPGLIGEFSVHRVGGFRGPPPIELVPRWAIESYQYTHSLVIWLSAALVVAGVRYLGRKNSWSWKDLLWPPLFAWALHILIDVPTHSTRFFPTPFLFPLSDYQINGISWATPWFFFTNFIVLAIIYIGFVVKKLYANKSARGS